MHDYENLQGSALWPEVIAYRLGEGIKADAIQKMNFAHKLEIMIPKLITRTNLKYPDREYLRFMKDKADTLVETMESIRIAYKENEYIKDIIAFSLLFKSDRMDFFDVYGFADTFRGFLEDDLKKIKPGKNSSSDLYICKFICRAFESELGVAPTCRDRDYTKDSGDIMDATPYERVCMEINRRYNAQLSWSSMRKAKRDYKSFFAKEIDGPNDMDKL